MLKLYSNFIYLSDWTSHMVLCFMPFSISTLVALRGPRELSYCEQQSFHLPNCFSWTQQFVIKTQSIDSKWRSTNIPHTYCLMDSFICLCFYCPTDNFRQELNSNGYRSEEEDGTWPFKFPFLSQLLWCGMSLLKPEVLLVEMLCELHW